MNKVYVNVIAEFTAEGLLIPLCLTWEDGRRYPVDRVLKKERCASRKAGGVGIMYTCRIFGKTCHLFFEVDKWFLERR